VEKEIKQFRESLDAIDMKGENQSGKAKQIDRHKVMKRVNKLILKYWFNIN